MKNFINIFVFAITIILCVHSFGATKPIDGSWVVTDMFTLDGQRIGFKSPYKIDLNKLQFVQSIPIEAENEQQQCFEVITSRRRPELVSNSGSNYHEESGLTFPKFLVNCFDKDTQELISSTERTVMIQPSSLWLELNQIDDSSIEIIIGNDILLKATIDIQI